MKKVTNDLDEGDRRAPLVAGAPAEQAVEMESTEEAKERKEFEELVEMADRMKREKGIYSSVWYKHTNPSYPS